MAGIDKSPEDLAELECSPEGSFYVQDREEDGIYEIQAFLGEVAPICQVFKANYFMGKLSAHNERRVSAGIPEIVALKLAKIDDSPDYKNLIQEVEACYKIGPVDDIENNNVTADHPIVGIFRYFDYRGFLCVVMPFFSGGSLRYIIDKRIYNWRLPEWCISAVLKEVLKGLYFLHRRGKLHSQLNAGNIFVCGGGTGGGFQNRFRGPMKIRLGYQGSTYCHCPEADSGERIWEQGSALSCVASRLPGNEFWKVRGIYEPRSSRREQQNYTDKSDIWNLGVMALELAFGPFREYRESVCDLRTGDDLGVFLTNLCDNEESKLPKLFELFLPDPGSRTADISTASKSVSEGLMIACRTVKGKIFGSKPQGQTLERVFDAHSEEGQEVKPTVEYQLSHSFIAMVKRCLVFDPEKRPTAEELLHDPLFQQHQYATLQNFRNFLLDCSPAPQKFRHFRDSYVRLMQAATPSHIPATLNKVRKGPRIRWTYILFFITVVQNCWILMRLYQPKQET